MLKLKENTIKILIHFSFITLISCPTDFALAFYSTITLFFLLFELTQLTVISFIIYHCLYFYFKTAHEESILKAFTLKVVFMKYMLNFAN